MRSGLKLLALLLLMMGTIWILQGTGIMPVGGMAYQIKWAYYGAALDLLAAGLLFANSRLARRRPPGG